jgi:hypothetical protein
MADIDYDKLGDAVARALKRSGGGGGFSAGGSNTGGGSGSVNLEKFGDSVKENLKTGVDGFVDAAKTSVSTFQGLSKSGANFSNDIIGMNVAAAQSRLSLNDFANVIANNGKNMAGLGGSVTRGAEAFGKLSKSFFDSNAGNELQQMGYTAKEVNEVLALQASTSRYTMGVEGEAGKSSRRAAADLAKEMDAIAKLTGKSKEEQMNAAKEAAANQAYQSKLMTMTEEEKAKAEKAGFRFSVRLNGTSDLDPTTFKLDNKTILEWFPDTPFYDYTKVSKRFKSLQKYPNYDLTFSFSGHNMIECMDLLTSGSGRVAMVFEGKTLPTKWNGFDVIDGDAYDMRYIDETGVIVGLKFKKVRNKIEMKNNKFIIPMDSPLSIYENIEK